MKEEPTIQLGMHRTFSYHCVVGNDNTMPCSHRCNPISAMYFSQQLQLLIYSSISNLFCAASSVYLTPLLFFIYKYLCHCFCFFRNCCVGIASVLPYTLPRRAHRSLTVPNCRHHAAEQSGFALPHVIAEPGVCDALGQTRRSRDPRLAP